MYELLAPAGSYEGFVGAINAGADAIYLAGKRFGARAYANNFSKEEIISAIKYAHLYNKKVYLTVNTLLKNHEIGELYDFLVDLYEANLDGVIVQDIGAIIWIKRVFPDMEIHASTQMCITGVLGARYLKNLGVKRVVLARELSAKEIKKIKDEVDIELEIFVHGAMCYSYSGTCLFSSILGGRSGNRGRCAQPCRLPYTVDGANNEEYILSLKDMCLLENINELMDIGVDSFKIEGRMKRAEYSAGVASIYRKYIDEYIESNAISKVSNSDLRVIKNLYIRGSISNGYLKKHNSKDMITFIKPNYEEASVELLGNIRAKYIEGTEKMKINMYAKVMIGERIMIEVSGNNNSILYEGAVVSEARNIPLDEAGIRKQLSKLGNTNFELGELNLAVGENCYLSVKELNEARRGAIEQYEQSIGAENITRRVRTELIDYKVKRDDSNVAYIINKLQIVVSSISQLKAISEVEYISKVFIDGDVFLKKKSEVLDIINANAEEECGYYIALPYILRNDDVRRIENILYEIDDTKIKGVLARNLEEIELLDSIHFKGEIVIDNLIYTFNNEAVSYYKSKGYGIVASYELNQGEIASMNLSGQSYYAYGRIPMMISANCVYNTKYGCKGDVNKYIYITDRYNKKIPIYLNCNYCYNLIYNSLPISLHKTIDIFTGRYKMSPILSFTNEDHDTTKHIVNYFIECLHGNTKAAADIGIEYTKGHLKRGVE